MYILSKFDAYNTNVQAHMHACTHMHAHTTRTHTRTHTHTHTHRVIYKGNGSEEKFFEKRKVFKKDLKELTEVE